MNIIKASKKDTEKRINQRKSIHNHVLKEIIVEVNEGITVNQEVWKLTDIFKRYKDMFDMICIEQGLTNIDAHQPQHFQCDLFAKMPDIRSVTCRNRVHIYSSAITEADAICKSILKTPENDVI